MLVSVSSFLRAYRLPSFPPCLSLFSAPPSLRPHRLAFFSRPSFPSSSHTSTLPSLVFLPSAAPFCDLPRATPTLSLPPPYPTSSYIRLPPRFLLTAPFMIFISVPSLSSSSSSSSYPRPPLRTAPALLFPSLRAFLHLFLHHDALFFPPRPPFAARTAIPLHLSLLPPSSCSYRRSSSVAVPRAGVDEDPDADGEEGGGGSSASGSSVASTPAANLGREMAPARPALEEKMGGQYRDRKAQAREAGDGLACLGIELELYGAADASSAHGQRGHVAALVCTAICYGDTDTDISASADASADTHNGDVDTTTPAMLPLPPPPASSSSRAAVAAAFGVHGQSALGLEAYDEGARTNWAVRTWLIISV
ncbi:hypothetical protein C8J57DRAFT_1563978 [Mycena rebaudengoi]|nr:hypothetical protein C8J57DRAFT_1563978 [Mycena rebaudengoi]